MNELRKYHPEWGNPITKEHTWYALNDKCILAQKVKIPIIQFTDHMTLKKKEDQSVIHWSFLEGGTKYPWVEIQRQIVEQRLKERPFRDCPNWRSIPYTVSKPIPFVDANKGLLTGAWCSCLLRGSASAWQIQKLMLTANQWSEHRVPNGGARKRIQGTEEVGSLIGRTILWTNQ